MNEQRDLLTFEDLCHIFVNNRSSQEYERIYSRQFYQRMSAYVFPYISNKSIDIVSSADVSIILSNVYRKTRRRTIASQLRVQMFQIFEYAIERGFYTHDNPVTFFAAIENQNSTRKMTKLSEIADLYAKSLQSTSIEARALSFSLISGLSLKNVLIMRKSNTIISRDRIIKIHREHDGEYRLVRALPESGGLMCENLPNYSIYIFSAPDTFNPIGHRRVCKQFSNFKRVNKCIEEAPAVFEEWVTRQFCATAMVGFLYKSHQKFDAKFEEQKTILQKWEEELQTAQPSYEYL